MSVCLCRGERLKHCTGWLFSWFLIINHCNDSFIPLVVLSVCSVCLGEGRLICWHHFQTVWRMPPTWRGPCYPGSLGRPYSIDVNVEHGQGKGSVRTMVMFRVGMSQGTPDSTNLPDRPPASCLSPPNKTPVKSRGWMLSDNFTISWNHRDLNHLQHVPWEFLYRVDYLSGVRNVYHHASNRYAHSFIFL